MLFVCFYFVFLEKYCVQNANSFPFEEFRLLIFITQQKLGAPKTRTKQKYKENKIKSGM